MDEDTSNDPNLFFAYQGANIDGYDHIRSLENNVFEFEDILGGGDEDFNDYIVEVSGLNSEPNPLSADNFTFKSTIGDRAM